MGVSRRSSWQRYEDINKHRDPPCSHDHRGKRWCFYDRLRKLPNVLCVALNEDLQGFLILDLHAFELFLLNKLDVLIVDHDAPIGYDNIIDSIYTC